MKRHGGLWAQVVDFGNLYRAYRRARMGKGGRADVIRFDAHLEHDLFRLRDELRSGEYRCGAYRQFTLYERKPRLISAAPFRDRVVHHAVMGVIEPLLDKRFIYDSYACRAGKGVHAAVDRYQGWAQRNRYALKLDIQRYFPSVDHDILKAQLRRYLKDPDVLNLLDRIIDHSPSAASDIAAVYFEGDDLFTPSGHRTGLPIGNLTSQLFANLYLNGFDHHVKEKLGASCYLRYVDDMIVLGDSKQALWDLLGQFEAALAKLRLRLHPRKQHLCPTLDGLDVLGFRVFPGHRELRADNATRFARKLRAMARAYAAGRYSLDDFRPSIRSWLGHAKHADTAALSAHIFDHTIFRRDST